MLCISEGDTDVVREEITCCFFLCFFLIFLCVFSSVWCHLFSCAACGVDVW